MLSQDCPVRFDIALTVQSPTRLCCGFALNFINAMTVYNWLLLPAVAVTAVVLLARFVTSGL